MCTVTFIARRRGYCLGMNRDEKLMRPTALPPTKRELNGRAILCPSEPGGGTWLALNDSGACLALINWYSVRPRVRGNAISRGEVVRMVSTADSPDVVNLTLNQLALNETNPFRLIGIFPAAKEIAEWRWNLKSLVCASLPWKTRQWISSGFDEVAAQHVRGKTFRRSLSQTSKHDCRWLRKLHRSHTPHASPFSTCMHRPDAATVSYTEVSVTATTATMRYCAGAPCQNLPGLQEHLRLRPTVLWRFS
jgi:hypothetical protein